MKTDEELFIEHAELNDLSISLYEQAEETRKMASKFYKDNFDAIHRHEMKMWKEKQEKKKTKAVNKEEQDVKVFEYLEPGMWVMVKTRNGLKWKQITNKSQTNTKFHNSYVHCAEPNDHRAVSYDRKEDTYSTLDLDVKDVYRTDVYVVSSIRHVLVAIGNGKYVKKSLRGEIIKENT